MLAVNKDNRALTTRRTQGGFIIFFAGTAIAFYTRTVARPSQETAQKNGQVDKKLLNNSKMMKLGRFFAVG
jgi:hypothetical protein